MTADQVITNTKELADALVRWYTDPATKPEQRQALVNRLGEREMRQ